MPELRLRRGRARRRGADPRARADARARDDARAARRRRRARALLRARASSARRSASRASTTALPLDEPPFELLAARDDADDRHRPAHRDHARGGAPVALRARRLAVPQPALSATAERGPSCRGAAATPARGCCATTAPGLAVAEPDDGRAACSLRSFARACRRFSPTIFGTTPCSGFASTSVTLSNDESVPFVGNWRDDDADALPRRRRLVDHAAASAAAPRARTRAAASVPADDVRHVDLVQLAVRRLRRAAAA